MNLPGYPRTRLPSVREIDATSGAPHTPAPPRPQQTSSDIQFRSRQFNLTIPAVVVAGIVAAIVGRQTAPVVPQNDTLRLDVRDLAVEVRGITQSDRETRAQQSQQEQALNAVRADVAGLRADVAALTRAVEETRR